MKTRKFFGRLRLRPLLLVPVGLGLFGSPAWTSPRFGVAAIHPDGSACVTLPGEALKTGAPLLFVLFSPPRVVDGKVDTVAGTPCNPGSDPPNASYTVKLRYRMSDADEVGVAISAAGARAEYAAGEFVVYTPESTTPLSFRECASQEGLHLTAWRGAKRAWHVYWYLGFDLEGDCTEEEIGD